MAFLSAITQFVLIAIICVQEVKKKSPAVFLWATLMVMFGVMHVFSVFIGNSEYATRTLNESSLFVLGFCFLYLLTRYILSLIYNKDGIVLSYDMVEDSSNNKIIPLVFLFVVVSFLMCYNLISFSGSIFNTSWSSGRNYSASLDYANTSQVNTIIYFSLSGLPLFLWIKRRYKLALVCLVMIILVTIVTRNRILVLPALIFILSLFVLKIKKLQMKHVVFAVIAGVAVIYLVYALRVFRHYGTIEVFLRDFDLEKFLNKINLYIATDNGELGLRNDFYFFVQNDNQFNGFGELATYVRMLLVYVPTRFSFGLKPADFAQTMGSAIGMVVGGSTHPTLFGDCYANAGVFGIFLGIFWAFYSFVADKIILATKKPLLKTLLFCLFAVTFVIIGRGSVYNSFFYVAWGMPALWLVIGILAKLPNIRIRWK